MKWVNYLLEKLNKQDFNTIPAGNYMFKVNIRNTSTRCEICSNLNNKGIFIVNFEHISHLVLVFLLLTLSRLMPAGIIDVIMNI